MGIRRAQDSLSNASLTSGRSRSKGEPGDGTEPSKIKVLVVEDSPTQATQLEASLEREGFEVEVASNGLEGLEQALTGRFDLVVSDILMPGLSGYELCRRIKSAAAISDLPVILLTVLDDPMDVIHGLDCGADNFITKPYEDAVLVNRIQTILMHKLVRARGSVAAGVEAVFMGRKFTIDAGKQQILDFLLATFEDAVRANRELRTNQAALEAATRQQQAQSEQLARVNAELEALVAAVSHDLKEPLRGVEAFSGLLLQEIGPGLDAQGKRYLDLVRDSAIRMRHLIDGLLAFATVGRSSEGPEQADLAVALREAMAMLRVQLNETAADVDAPKDLPTLPGHPILLARLFTNLLGNALKFRRPEKTPRIVIKWRPIDRGIEVTVADNGLGVPAEHRERVFALFQRLHPQERYPGTGVGLALCKRIVEEHGGTIGLEETAGGGCTVRFTLVSSRAAYGRRLSGTRAWGSASS